MLLPVHKDLYEELQYQLRQIDNTDPLCGTIKAIDICREKLHALRYWVKDHPFPDVASEIDFFKKVKPLFNSRFLFYQEIYLYHINMPPGGDEMRAAQVNTILTRIQQFYTDHHEFYAYYRGNYTECDESYFTRSHYNPQIAGHFQHSAYHAEFCTNYDEKLAQLLAYEQVNEYLLQPSACLAHAANLHENAIGNSLTWTAPRIAFIELVYALQTIGAFNHGNADIKEIVADLSTHFHIPAGNVYRAYLELRLRKTGRTKFLDKMRDELNRRMDQLDEL